MEPFMSQAEKKEFFTLLKAMVRGSVPVLPGRRLCIIFRIMETSILIQSDSVI
jgi:hypothetical protein